MKSIHKPLVAITILGVGVFLFFLARCGETHSNAKTDTNPGAEDFQPIVLEKQTVDQKSTAEFGKKSQLADGKVSDQAASRAAMRSALETGAELYSTNSSDLIRQLKDKLAIIPKNLHNAFWRKFIEGAAEVGDTNYHLQKLTNLDPKLKDFLTTMTTADSSSVLEGLAAAMSQQGYSKNPDEFARSIKALPEAAEYQIENKKLWTKIAVQGKLYSNPLGGVALLKTLEPSLQRELAPGLARKLSFYDPAAALSFFLSSDYGAPSERSTVTFLMQTFLEKEPLELSKLLRDAQSSPQKDAAAAYLSNRLASSDYEAATSWAESIKDDKIKRQALAEIQQIRNAKNPTALDSLFNTGE